MKNKKIFLYIWLVICLGMLAFVLYKNLTVLIGVLNEQFFYYDSNGIKHIESIQNFGLTGWAIDTIIWSLFCIVNGVTTLSLIRKK